MWASGPEANNGRRDILKQSFLTLIIQHFISFLPFISSLHASIKYNKYINHCLLSFLPLCRNQPSIHPPDHHPMYAKITELGRSVLNEQCGSTMTSGSYIYNIPDVVVGCSNIIIARAEKSFPFHLSVWEFALDLAKQFAHNSPRDFLLIRQS